jgi:hypothetical protein
VPAAAVVGKPLFILHPFTSHWGLFAPKRRPCRSSCRGSVGFRRARRLRTARRSRGHRSRPG